MVLFESGGISTLKSFLSLDFNEERRRNPWPVCTKRPYRGVGRGARERGRAGKLLVGARPLALFWHVPEASGVLGC
ncbi:hypothetical protein ERO13_A10G132432v2 [Gossypium hirsutum]|nr:hypothetical protein ERO13_A10G132432v2 [Gossypium hirsutum]